MSWIHRMFFSHSIHLLPEVNNLIISFIVLPEVSEDEEKNPRLKRWISNEIIIFFPQSFQNANDDEPSHANQFNSV